MSTTEAEPTAARSGSIRDQLLDQAARALDLARDVAHEGQSHEAMAIMHVGSALQLTLAATLQPPEPRADAPPEIQEGWYAIELMGHRTRTGYIRPVLFAGRGLVEIREPEHAGRDGHGDERQVDELVEFYSPAAIFALSPSSEQEVLEHLTNRDSIPF